jgi:WD40 repeat protein
MEKIRFSLMGEEYLTNLVGRMVGGENQELMAGVVAEAMRTKAARREGAALDLEVLGRNAVVDRRRPGVRWEEYIEGGELRLKGHYGTVLAIVACDGRICSGSHDGSIRVWNSASGEVERTLRPQDTKEDMCSPGVNALVVCEDRLISSHGGGKVRVWNVATGECEQVLEGHDCKVWALAVCGSRLAGGCEDMSIKVWGMGAGTAWAMERSLAVQGGGEVWSLAGWRDSDKVACGLGYGGIRVWDVGTGALDATLKGHSGAVTALVVHEDRLLSASEDGTIRAWGVGGAWAALRTVEAYGEGLKGPYLRCLAVSGSKLVSGAVSVDGSRAEVRVWGLEELDLQQTLALLSNSSVYALAAVDGEVWGGAGHDVAVWGRAM